VVFKRLATPLIFALISGICVVCLFMPTTTLYKIAPTFFEETIVQTDKFSAMGMGIVETVKHYPNLYAGLIIVLIISVIGFLFSVRQINEVEQ
jgi:hypothetical protein